MDDIKNAWLTYFISIRDSRREDMRHYSNLWKASLISNLLFLSTLYATGYLFTNRGIVAGTIVCTILCLSFLRFRNEYRIAEKEIKDYSDAIELTIVNRPKTNKEYRQLYYLLTIRTYIPTNEWGQYLHKNKYKIFGFKSRKRQNREFFDKYRQDFPLLYKCYCKPREVKDSLKMTTNVSNNK